MTLKHLARFFLAKSLIEKGFVSGNYMVEHLDRNNRTQDPNRFFEVSEFEKRYFSTINHVQTFGKNVFWLFTASATEIITEIMDSDGFADSTGSTTLKSIDQTSQGICSSPENHLPRFF